jgi:hypothetical protein
VVSTVTVEARPKISSTSSAAASSTCSQLSNTTRAGQRRGNRVRHRQIRLRSPPQGHGDHVGYRRRVANRDQLDQQHAITKLTDQFRRDLHRQTGLAHSTEIGERHEPVPTHQVSQLLLLDLTIHELVACWGTFPGVASTVRKGREPRLEPLGLNLEQVLDLGQIT